MAEHRPIPSEPTTAQRAVRRVIKSLRDESRKAPRVPKENFSADKIFFAGHARIPRTLIKCVKAPYSCAR